MLSLWLVAAASVGVLNACGTSDDHAARAFRESDLAEIVRTASDDLALVEAESGPQTLAQLAEEAALSVASIRDCGFVAASDAMFQGGVGLPSIASARLFRDSGGADCYLRLHRETFAADVDTDSEPLDTTRLGAGAIGFSTTLGGLLKVSGYYWRVDNLVLEVAAPPKNARSFAERLDERAKAIR